METSHKVIRSRDNSQVKLLLRLASSSRARKHAGSTILDGPHLVEAYGRSGGTAEILAAGASAYADPPLRELFDRTPARTRLLLADELVARIAQVVTSSGILAVIRTPEKRPLPESLGGCLILEGLQDPGNLGSILRTAVASGMRDVLLTAGSVFAWAPKVVRAGQGAHFFLSIYENVAVGDIPARARARIVATEPRAPVSLYEADLTGPVAWLFGNEGAGLSAEAAALANDRVRIPLPGRAESLNVAAAVAVCLFEQLRQNRNDGSGGHPK